ncbi:hypothetical protein N9059_01735, partial [bacterium]|nr:hypothetical protein [bacterium]
VNVQAPLDDNGLAQKNVERLAEGSTFANLIPEERIVNYRQRLTDRLWMRGIGAVIVCYMLMVGVYFGWLQYLDMESRKYTAMGDILEPDYKQSLELDARMSVQKQQIGLRYAALDGWLAVSETIPEGVVLNSYRFSKGADFSLTGTVALDQIEKVTDFNQSLSEYEMNGNKIFSKVSPPTIQQTGSKGGATMSWSFSAVLQEVAAE